MKLIRILLSPLVILNGVFVVIRNILFNLNILKKNLTDIFSIGVGNLSMGGSGKSILVDYLISTNLKSNQISVISRGYGRKSNGLIIANLNSSADEIGDEPYQYLTKYPSVKVIVSEKRITALEKISELGLKTDLLIFDDIMQHRSILTNHLIITTTFNNPFFNDYLFPYGNLREFRVEKKRGNTILVTKCPKKLSSEDKIKIVNRMRIDKNQKVFFSFIKYSKFLKNSFEKINFDTLKNKKITLVTGIADPSDLVSFLDSKEINFTHLKFKDHFNFNKKAVSKIINVAKNSIILTTEKDYGRLFPFLKSSKLYFLPVELSFFSESDEIDFNRRIKSSYSS